MKQRTNNKDKIHKIQNMRPETAKEDRLLAEFKKIMEKNSMNLKDLKTTDVIN